MDFIPKALLADVKTLKKPFQQKNARKSSFRSDEMHRAARTRKASSIRPNSVLDEFHPDVETILSSASRSHRHIGDFAETDETEKQEGSLLPKEETKELKFADLQSKSSKASLKSALSLKTNSKPQTPAVENDEELEIFDFKHAPRLSVFDNTLPSHIGGDSDQKIITTRKEVAKIKIAMQDLLKSLEINGKQEYPTEMDLFMHIIREENKICDTVFQEVIRQVTVNMTERGEILSEIRNRYAQMFKKIPAHVLNLHTELVAHRKLNRRLSEELHRAKESLAEMLDHLNFVREHDTLVTQQAEEAREKLLAIMNEAESAEESREEFHNLYKLQRVRLEQSLRVAEKEKRLWVDAATHLAMRMGKEYGMPEFLALQKCEEGRLRITNHIIVLVGDHNNTDLLSLEQKVDEWRFKITKISKEIVQADYKNVELLAGVKKSMRKVLQNLITNEPQNEIELGHRLLNDFHVMDVASLNEQLEYWIDQVLGVSSRFTSGKDVLLREEIVNTRKLTNSWVEAGFKVLRRNQDSTSGDEYLSMNESLRSLQQSIFDWMTKLETRISGEDGVSSLVFLIQSQIEDRLSLLKGGTKNKPLLPTERTQTIESLHFWIDQIGFLANKLSNTAEREQTKIPVMVEHWISKILQQMNLDMDTRHEDNSKIHTSLISWIVNLLLPVRNVQENATDQFEALASDLMTFKTNLLRDGADIEMISDDQRDLRKLMNDICDGWERLGRKLLIVDFNLPKMIE